METIRIFSAPVPAMPSVWPIQRNKQKKGQKKTVQLPQRVQEPVPIGYYLEPLKGITGKPNRSEILRAYFSSVQ